ncbi:MAG: hypothetical protein JWO22_962 [Frankiales bacterium]|nr:hypothetical protein [Frankiales bacterium]
MPPTPTQQRCAAHPGRPAVDTCPVCERSRCGADAAEARGGGCAVCHGVTESRAHVAPSLLELRVRGLVAAHLAATLWGFVVAEYVQADLFEYAAPAILGAVVGGATLSASGQPRGTEGTRTRLVAALYALLGCAFGFVKEGTFTVFSTSTDVLIPYAVAVGACWLWTLPPKTAR